MSFGDKFKAAMDRFSGKTEPEHSEIEPEEKNYGHKSAVVKTEIDGKPVQNLSLWMDEIAECCRKGRDIHYGPEGFVGYIEDCQRLYVGEHWEDIADGDAPLQFAEKSDYKVENRIAEKIEIIAPIMVQGRPTIGVLPRTGGDVEKASVVADILDEKLRESQFELYLTQSMLEAPKYGTAILETQHFLHRNEPSGFPRFKVCDPLSIAWEPGAPRIEDARVIVHIELMDRSEAEAHFTFLLGQPVENLPCEGDSWQRMSDWSLVHRSNIWSDKSTYANKKFLDRTRLTWIWYMDSERREEDIMQPAEVLKRDADGNPIPKMLDDQTQDVNLETGEMLWETETVEQPMLVNDLDEFGQPIVDELGQPIMKVAKRNVPVYRNGRLFIKAGDDRIIYDGENPYLHGQFPFTSFTFIPVNGSPFGKPLAQNVYTDQQRINAAVTQIAKHASLCGNPAIEVDESALDPSELDEGFTNRPGRVWKKKSGVTANVIRPIEYQAVNSSVIQNYQLASASFERIAGVSNVSSGDSAASESGLKVQTLDQITERKLEPFAISRDMGMERIGKQFLSNINQFVSKEEIVRIVVDSKVNPLDPLAVSQQQVEFGALMDYLDDPLSLKYDVIVVPQRGTMTTRQQKFIQSREQALQGLIHPSIPLQYSDVPNATTPQIGGMTPPPKNKTKPVTGEKSNGRQFSS